MKRLIVALAVLPGLVNAEPYHLKPVIPPLKIVEHDGYLFEQVVSCYPAPSLFDMDLKFQAGLKGTNSSEYYDRAGFQTNAYAGLVLEVPLYSTQERYRALHEESKRREQLAKDIATLDKAVAKRVKSEDMYELYKALEARAAVRVKDGYTPLTEQVGYIEKGAQAYADFIDSQAEINAAIADISAFCTKVTRPGIERLLKEHVAKGAALYEMDKP